jgi:hypothetical protein
LFTQIGAVMHRTTTIAAVALSGLAALTFAANVAAANADGVPAIPLNNEQEPNDPATGASGFFTYTIQGDQLCYTLEARDLAANAVAAHVHVAPRETNGPVVVGLSVGTGTTWDVSACTTATPAVLSAIAADPRAYYVNVHTSLHPGGEIRGQLK